MLSISRSLVRGVILGAMVAAITTVGYAPVAQAADQITITQWYHQYGEEGTQQAVQKYADEYHQLNPNITVKVNWVLGDYMTDKLPAALQTADAPDVYEVSPFVTADLVQAGLAADLSDIYTPADIKDFGPLSMGYDTVNGKPYGVAMVNNPILIFYNKKMLADANVKPPTTMTELMAAAKALTTNKVSGLYIGNNAGKEAFVAKLAMFSAGSVLLKDGQAGFDNDRSAAAWAALATLSNSGNVLVGAPTDWWDPSALTDGNAAMQLCGLWALPGIKAAMGDNFGVIPWPALDAQGKQVTTLGGWSEVVNGKSKNVEAAKAFVKWLWIQNSADQKDWNTSYGFHIPPRSSVAASTDKLSSGQALEVVNFAAKDAVLEGDAFWTTEMDQALTDAVTNVIANGADPKTEIHNAATKINGLLKNISAPSAATMAATTAK